MSRKIFRKLQYLDRIESSSIDMVICSYALYFFPESIKDIARILAPSGKFITITHASTHLNELIEIIREAAAWDSPEPATPLERLIRRFSDKNGYEQLQHWFRGVRMIQYENSMTFDSGSISDLIRYVRHKKAFFIPPQVQEKTGFQEQFESRIREKALETNMLRITKNDAVFICSGSLWKESR